jgi:hypothetical protein
MKSKTPNKILLPLVLTLGAISAFGVAILMATGDVQKIIKFSGDLEEMVFTVFAIFLGILSIAATISTLHENKNKTP